MTLKSFFIHQSCQKCAYFHRSHPEFVDDGEEGEWLGFSSYCHLKMWQIGYEECPGENILSRAYKNLEQEDGEPEVAPKTEEELRREYGNDFGITIVPMKNKKWYDLAEKNHCRHFFPKTKMSAMSREKCREEQLEIKASWRFWIPTAIAVAAIAISIFGP